MLIQSAGRNQKWGPPEHLNVSTLLCVVRASWRLFIDKYLGLLFYLRYDYRTRTYPTQRYLGVSKSECEEDDIVSKVESGTV